jgi:hypothetical protein
VWIPPALPANRALCNIAVLHYLNALDCLFLLLWSPLLKLEPVLTLPINQLFLRFRALVMLLLSVERNV